MRWAHRAIPAEVTMQGALYGLEVIETSAAFSSRYHARTLTPGVRCKTLAADDLNDEWLRQDLQEVGIDLASCRQGDLVPVAGGNTFACLKQGGGLLRVNADINAAQNLQRRFWTRHGDAFRLPCIRVVLAEGEIWVPRNLGKRLQGALGGPGLLRPTGHPSGSCRWEPTTAARLRRLGGGAAGSEDAVAVDPDVEELEALAEEAEVHAGRVEVFFRDPSGVVLADDRWYPAQAAWPMSRTRTVAEMKVLLGAAVPSR
jgi:hypothetical protein